MGVLTIPCRKTAMREDKGNSIDFWMIFLIVVLVVLVVFVWKNYPILKQAGFDLTLAFPSLGDLGSSISSGFGKFGGR